MTSRRHQRELIVCVAVGLLFGYIAGFLLDLDELWLTRTHHSFLVHLAVQLPCTIVGMFFFAAVLEYRKAKNGRC